MDFIKVRNQMKIVILGMQGVGKTTVGKLVADELGLKYINYGDVMQEMISMNRDEFRRNAKFEDFKKIQIRAAKKIGKMKNIVLTTHTILFRKDGYYPGFPLEVLKLIKPDRIIFLYSKPADIRKRRLKDKRPGRDTTKVAEIKFEQEFAEKIAMVYGVISGVPVMYVENKEGKVKDAVERIVSVLK